MVDENETNEPEITEETGEEIGEEIAEVVEEAVEAVDPDPAPDVEVNTTVIEAEEPEAKTSYVDVGDLHISGPPDMVSKITEKYLKDHIDHNPHPVEATTEAFEDTVEAATPEVVEDVIEETAASETVDNPPEPSDWLFGPLSGR